MDGLNPIHCVPPAVFSPGRKSLALACAAAEARVQTGLDRGDGRGLVQLVEADVESTPQCPSSPARLETRCTVVELQLPFVLQQALGTRGPHQRLECGAGFGHQCDLSLHPREMAIAPTRTPPACG
jgi:hypothetical protein